MTRLLPVVGFVLVAACGNAEIVAPGPLVVVDTFPGQGALVAAGDVPIALVFSESVDRATLESSAAFQQTTPTGTLIQERTITLEDYDDETVTAIFEIEPLPADATFLLRIRADEVRASSGARLASDVMRRFRTSAD